MADSGKNAITTYSGDGSTLTFALAWTTSPASSSGLPYLATSHILVEELISAAWTTQNETTDYTISADGLSVVYNAGNAPASASSNVRITRVTPHTSLFVTFQDGAPVSEADLRDSLCQCIYYTEEVEDQI